jgi:Bacterial Ig-like domain (group 1)/Bacterial Ig-like domain (group 2)
MPPMLRTTPRFSWFQHVSRGVAVVTSTGAALVSIITALYSYGVFGHTESHRTIGNYGAAWVRLKPAIDTATAIGDTVPFAATIADKNGSILVGATPTWTTGDSAIATVTSNGSVIARGPGLTTVSVVVGELVANARILVTQQVAGIAIANPAGDTAVAIVEGSQLQLHARALDARGHTVPGRVAVWHIDDSTVASVGPSGIITAQNGGRSVVRANVEGASAYLPVAVVTPASALAVVSGANQRSLAGHLLPQRVVVRATNRKGAPASGKLVTFHLRGAQGKVDPGSATTDANGRARTQWTLGDDPGVQTLLATVENVDSIAVVDAEAEPIARNTRVAALVETLRARAGLVLGDSVGVRITDSTGRALQGVPVRWSAVDGTVESVDARTDSTGVARARWTLAAKVGRQRLRAFVGAADSRIAPSIIVATALAGAPATSVVVSGDRQRGAAGHALPKSIVLRVVDAGGNGAADVPVGLSLSGGAVDDSALVTDSLGLVKTRWTMGRSAGDYALAAHVDGIKKPLKLSAHATPARPANLSFDDAPPVKNARPHTKRLVALVTDIFGNPVADTPVTFSVKSGAVTPTRAVTDARGRVALSWMMGTSTSEQILKGSVRGSDVTGAYVAQIEHPIGRR